MKGTYAAGYGKVSSQILGASGAARGRGGLHDFGRISLATRNKRKRERLWRYRSAAAPGTATPRPGGRGHGYAQKCRSRIRQLNYAIKL
ncbi:hypothetical protein EVAR_41847_1 [Eumeta japonica]|uniref:Uncharacterized protein n=1 Tax=Eumeta variegata TaxID=151549 RepID=A0A4C1XCX0_EUMVA|nr:hypothetical protein EVAR_41847_1 [Eumeta japonica]